MILRMLALLVVCGLLAAAPARAGELERQQIRVGDLVITVVVHAGQTYRLVTPGNLGDAKLLGQLVCLEGKIKDLDENRVRLFDLDSWIPVSGNVLARCVPGDNVWLGGKLARDGEGRNVLTITAAVQLKSDLALFEDRFAAMSATAEWGRLLDLAEWISRSREYNPKISFDEHRRYRSCVSRAVNRACAAAEAAFGETDAAGYVELAAQLKRVGADAELYLRYLKRAAAIDPDNPAAIRRLAELGMVRFRGQWLAPEQKKRLEAEEKERLARRAAEVKALTERRLAEAINGAASAALDIAEMETAAAGLRGQDLAARLASEIERAAGPRQINHALFLASWLPRQLQAAPMEAALRSADPLARLAALEMAGARGDRQAREWIVRTAGRESSEEVAGLACGLLGEAADAPAIEALIALVDGPREAGSRAAIAALYQATKEERYTRAEWDAWWKRNRAAFPAGPSD
jgi:hypothetical protein